MTMMRTMKMIMMMMMMMLMMRKSRFALMEVQRGFLRRVSIGFCPRAISKRDKFAKYCQKLGQQKCPQDGFATRVVLCLLWPKTCRIENIASENIMWTHFLNTKVSLAPPQKINQSAIYSACLSFHAWLSRRRTTYSRRSPRQSRWKRNPRNR